MKTRSRCKDTGKPVKAEKKLGPFPAPPDPPAKRKHKLIERDQRWICVFADTAEEVPYGEQTSEDQLAVYRRNLDSLLPAAEPRTARTRPAQSQPAIPSSPSEAPAQAEAVEFEEVEILLTPAQPAKFSPPSISRERYWDAITDRLKVLVVEEIKDQYGPDYARTDQLRRELNDIQSRASHAYPNWNVFNDARCLKIKLQQDADLAKLQRILEAQSA